MVSIADKPACAKKSLKLLLVGPREEDYFNGNNLNGKTDIQLLDHAHSAAEIEARLGAVAYDLLLFQHESSDDLMSAALQSLRLMGRTVPFLVLAEDVPGCAGLEDSATEASCEFVAKEELGRESFLRTIRYAANLHRSEEQVKTAEQMLRKLHSAVEQSADMVSITDVDGHIEYVNPAFEKTTGYELQEVIGSTPRFLRSGEHGSDFYNDLWNTLKSGGVFRGVLVNRKKTGESLVVEKTITPVRDAEGRITNFISNDRDISDRRQLETALFQAQKMDAIGKLAGGVAHDFNNLLMVISSYAELMLDEIAEEKPRRHLQEIQGAARRAAELTRQLLAFGRKQSQQLQLLDLNRVLQDIIKTLPRLIGEDIEVGFQAAEKLAKVKLDSIQIEQVIMNLASNARDAMPRGGKFVVETRNIELDEGFVQARSFIPKGSYVLLEVTDSGSGIPPEHLPHIFEPFYTTKAQGKGTGLGLATVYGIIKQNGGFVWVSSVPNGGTTFKIYFPEATEGEKPATLTTEVPASEFRGTETILVVEDEGAVRRPTCEFLATAGYRVLEAANGQDALNLLKAHEAPISLMITDVVMPNVGGGELAEQVPGSHPETKILFVSGYAESALTNRKIADLRQNFLQKPFSLRSLGIKIREVLSRPPEA